ncbi:signal peptidase II [Pedococcus sp. P5_B7]
MLVENCSGLPSMSPDVLPGRGLGTRRTGGPTASHGQSGLFGATAVAISTVDLTSKAVAQSLLHKTMVHTNPALSLGHAPFAPEVHMLAAGMGIAVYCLFAWWCTAKRRLPFWPLAALLGGALGNFIDHLEGDGIIDFIRVGTVIFNLADVAVLVGVGGAGALGVTKLFRPI